jgi:hypothetical protein
LSASYLVVAGGGSASQGGGGAGGMLTGSGLVIDANSTYVVTVGAGGAGGSVIASGTASSFSLVSTTAVGGGFGGILSNGNGANGGSGGGASWGGSGVPGVGTAGQGNNGGTGRAGSGGVGSGDGFNSGGGGGAGAVGQNAIQTKGGNGGNGLQSSITGTATYYAGGGGGSTDQFRLPSGATSTGGLGGGGNGVLDNTSGQNGTANTGGGGGGGATNSGGSGGSGIVIISYAGTQQMAGGTVTSVGGNTIHTFTSSGYLTPIKLVGRSLRFRSSASAYLNRTMTTPTNNLKWTWSAWVKRGTLGTSNQLFDGGDGSSNNFGALAFRTEDTLQFAQTNGGSYNVQVYTTAVFRDPAAWYHIVVVYDSPNATSTDRIQIYVNGTRQTALTYLTGPFAQNTASKINSAIAHYIGKLDYAGIYFDGYQTEVNFIDGQALTPSSFGTFNSYGVWQPITYGGSYGINGFYLPFSNNTSTTTLGLDFSPNGNNWTTNNISVTAGVTYDSMTDVPTLTSATAANYPTFNAVNSNATLSRANLQSLSPTASWVDGISTMAFPVGVGKWYVEATNTSNSNECIFGVTNTTLQAGSTDNYRCAYSSSGLVVRNGYSQGDTTGLATYTTNDVIGMAVDCAAGTVAFYKNNTLINTTTAADFIVKELIAYTRQNNAGFNINFGQRPFAYTPPSGFVALNTYNL